MIVKTDNNSYGILKVKDVNRLLRLVIHLFGTVRYTIDDDTIQVWKSKSNHKIFDNLFIGYKLYIENEQPLMEKTDDYG